MDLLSKSRFAIKKFKQPICGPYDELKKQYVCIRPTYTLAGWGTCRFCVRIFTLELTPRNIPGQKHKPLPIAYYEPLRSYPDEKMIVGVAKMLMSDDFVRKALKHYAEYGCVLEIDPATVEEERTVNA